MDSTVEKEVYEEIKKAQDWYAKRYRKSFEVHQRYDKALKHFSWRLAAEIGGQVRVLAFGIAEAKAETKAWPEIKARILDHIKQSLIKAQVKYEPHILALV